MSTDKVRHNRRRAEETRKWRLGQERKANDRAAAEHLAWLRQDVIDAAREVVTAMDAGVRGPFPALAAALAALDGK